MYSVSKEIVPKFLSGELPGNQTWDLLECKNVAGWTYDQRLIYISAHSQT